MADTDSKQRRRELTNAELGAIAHLYRGEIYRSTIWRTRLDTTTNWAVVTLGVALSITFSSPSASPLPLVLVGILILFFLMLEARRYRYFNVWRARARWIENHLYAPLLVDGDLHMEEGWQATLAEDYWHPHYHISFMTALGRRIRRNYLWILLIQAASYVGKLIVHPIPLTSLDQFMRRADVGPIPGEVMIAMGAIYVTAWCAMAIWSEWHDRRRFGDRPSVTGMG
ncbi:DUF2270 domain-containing protein [Rhizobiales bacterium]|uniref:DUF2270 domain-containing protein n=1 Tax=Hongsoonwoonella zoysiae TaxID=2821844 RepID=UPI00155F9A9C|nr:DUF2270 domain-containing protein [Hongsoonwoonella zoysiae]NRG18628.1 DUF2270 domain-containing protein [Hongsoonwoonella zoysiae]